MYWPPYPVHIHKHHLGKLENMSEKSTKKHEMGLETSVNNSILHFEKKANKWDGLT